MTFRIGLGYDIHKFVAGRKLVLGGTEIPCHLGLDGHSDADVVLHALSDAILGALALPDIGVYFPDNQEDTKNLDSKKILLFAKNKMSEQGFQIANIDIVIIAEEPKLSKFFEPIRLSLSNLLKIEPSQIGLKAKTNEGLGEIGQKHAIATFVNVLLQKN